MRVVLSSRPFDPWQSLQAFQVGSLQRGSYGATAVFVGTMRDFNEGEAVESLYLQHYPGMTERELVNAMRPGSRSPLEERPPEDLGRFGLGLKTASFSQCRQLTVASKTLDSSKEIRSWDLGKV